MKIYYPKDKEGNVIGFRTPESYVYDDNGNNLSDKLNVIETTKADIDYVNDSIDAKEITGLVSGSDPTINDSSEHSLLYSKINGLTEQTTLTGKNLLNINTGTEEIYGITWTTNDDGSITADGTATSDSYRTIGTIALQSDITYTMSGCPSGGGQTTYYIQANVDSGDNVKRDTGNSISFTPSSEQTTSFYTCIKSGVTVDEVTFYPQIEVGDEATEYEPYVGLKESPSPDYPQDIVGLGDSGTIEVKTCGKNLFYLTLVNRTTNGITFTVLGDGGINVKGTNSSTTDYVHYHMGFYLPSTGSYIISGCPSGGSAQTYHLGYWSTNISYGREIGDGATINLTGDSTWLMLRITIHPAVTVEQTFYPMVRSASVVDDTFEPYTENVVNIPIDSPLYNGDYIEEYADGSGKLVRNMKCVVLDGTTYSFTGKSESEQNILYYSNSFTDAYQPSRDEVAEIYSNRFFAKSYAETYDTSCVGVSYKYYDVGELRFGFGLDSELTTLELANEWLLSNPITVVYKLATPEETELTEEQIEAFKQLYTFEDVTNVYCDGDVTIKYYKNSDNGKVIMDMQDQVDNLESKLNNFDFSSLTDDQITYLKTALGLS